MDKVKNKVRELFIPHIELSALADEDISCLSRKNTEPSERDLRISMVCITRELEYSLLNLY